MINQKNLLAAKPIFIFGCYRSGTTLMAMILNSHSKIQITKESRYISLVSPKYEKENLNDNNTLNRFITEIKPYLLREDWKNIPSIDDVKKDLDTVDLPTLIKYIALFNQSDEVIYWGDNTPIYIEAIQFLDALFPDAKFIIMIRDPRDIVADSLKTKIGGININSIIGDWILRVSYGIFSEKIYGNNKILHIKYENLVTKTQTVLNIICKFLDIEFEQQMLEYYKNPICKEIYRNKRHHKGLQEKINTSQIGIYAKKFKKNEIDYMNAQLAIFLRYFNYDYKIDNYLFIEYGARYKDYAYNYFGRAKDKRESNIKKILKRKFFLRNIF